MLSTNNSPAISIIMPAYNRAAYITETIQSVRNQTYQHWELIILDDQSTDNTAALVEQITDQRIQFYKTGERLGITGTRNAGIEKAKNELIAFVDSDDLWANTKLEKQVAALQQYPEAGFCLTGGFNFKRLNEVAGMRDEVTGMRYEVTGNRLVGIGLRCEVTDIPYPITVIDYFYKQRDGIKYDRFFIPYFKSEVSTTTSSLIFKKKCLDATGIFSEHKIFAEVDLILNLAKLFKGIILYEPLLYRRLHESNISNEEWEKGYEEGIALLRAYQNMLPPKVTRDAYFRLYINSGEDYLLRNKRMNAVNKFFKAWAYKPFSVIPARKIIKAFLGNLINKG